MKKYTILTAVALAGVGTALVAPRALADPQISVPFVPVNVEPQPCDD
jgi:hypothetical protein